ncbi:MAG: hypothetical protein HYR94_01920 [Chloroflexi bacterium]|nr:hypothetical protein [Chloroflexota bacterium]
MRSVETLRTLKAELIVDVEELAQLYRKYELMQQKLGQITPDEFDYVALAYTIVNLYNLIQSYFLRIAKVFENNLDPSSWHKQLLQRMSLEIEGLRPAFMTAQDYPFFDKLRAFRHIFRHIYQRELDMVQLAELDQSIPAGITRFNELHLLYLSKLDEMIERLDALEQ